jgi:hypothetical protein
VSDGGKHGFWTPIKHGNTFGPASRDVGPGQGGEVSTGHVAATMGNEICFEKTGLMIIPLGKGADGDLMLEQRSRLRG